MSVGNSSRFLPSRVANALARRRQARTDRLFRARQLVVVKGVGGLAELEHDVVRHVDHVADGPNAAHLQAALHPIGRGPELRVTDDAGGETRVKRRVLDHDLNQIGGVFGGVLDVGCVGIADLLAGQGGHLARDAKDAGAAGDVGQDGDLKDRVAEVILQRRADGRIGRQKDDAFVLIAQAEFLLRAHHRVVLDPAQHRFLERGQNPAFLVSIVELRALERKNDFLAAVSGGNVGRAGDDGDLTAGPVVDGGQGEFVGVGMALHLEQLANEDPLPVPDQLGAWDAEVVDLLDLETGQGEHFGQFSNGQIDIDVVFEPRNGYAHSGGILAGCFNARQMNTRRKRYRPGFAGRYLFRKDRAIGDWRGEARRPKTAVRANLRAPQFRWNGNDSRGI